MDAGSGAFQRTASSISTDNSVVGPSKPGTVLGLNTAAQKSKGNKRSLQCSSLRKYQCVQLGSSNDCGSASSAAVQMGQKPGGKERQLAQLAKQPVSLLILSASLSASFAFSSPGPSYRWWHQVPGPAQVVQVVQLLQGIPSIRTVVRRPGNVERRFNKLGRRMVVCAMRKEQQQEQYQSPKSDLQQATYVHVSVHSPALNPIKHRLFRS